MRSIGTSHYVASAYRGQLYRVYLFIHGFWYKLVGPRPVSLMLFLVFYLVLFRSWPVNHKVVKRGVFMVDL